MTQPSDGPYPEALIRTVEVGGQPLLLRPVRPQDAPRLVEAVGRCSPDDVRFRFAGGVRALRLEQAARFAQVDYDRQMGLVAETAAGDILGAARVDLDPQDGTAEYSIMVRSDQQGRGLGGLLLEAVRDYAIGRGAREVWGDVAADNGRMLQLCDELGFRREASADPGRFRVVWRP
jgi:GNAT superfamily N-acetyltransferase